MMKARSILVGLVFAVSVCAASVEHTGNWWRQQSQAAKISYLCGVMDGLKASINALGRMNGGAVASDALRELCKGSLSKLTMGQLADGLDQLYRDFRNRSIMVGDAVWVVGLQISGADDELVADVTAKLRREAR